LSLIVAILIEDIKRESTENSQRDKKKKKGSNNKSSNKTQI